MEIISILLFIIYSLIILGILVFVSPLFSAFLMISIPVILVFILPDEAIAFFSIVQFSYSGIQVFNLHILLLIWSAFIGMISYAEVLTWYLLRETEPAQEIKEAPVIKETGAPDAQVMTEKTISDAAQAKTEKGITESRAANEKAQAAGSQPNTIFYKIKDFFQKLYKILKGEKIKLRQ